MQKIKVTEEQEGEIATITFATKDDAFKVTSKYKNLNNTNKDTFSTAVHDDLKIRYRVWEKAAYKARIDSKNTVSTKIRPAPTNGDFMLLIRRKDDKTSWSRISATLTSIDPVAIFQVGEINEDDKCREAAEWHEKDERIKRSRVNKNMFLNNQITANPNKIYPKDDEQRIDEWTLWTKVLQKYQ